MVQESRATGDVVATAQRLADGGRPAEAAAMLARLLESEPGHTEARYLLAVSHLRAGDVAAAEAGFRSVIAQLPQDHRAFHGLGLALERQGKSADAVNAFATAAAINPGFAHAQRKLAEHGIPAAEGAGAGAASQPPPSPAPAAPNPPAGPSQPPRATVVGDLRGLGSTTGRMVRGTALLLVWLGLLGAVAWTGIAMWVTVVDGQSDAAGFIALFGGTAVALLLPLRWLGKRGAVRLRGVVRQLSARREPLPGGGRGAPPLLQVLAFNLETTDRHRHRFPQVAVELAAKRMRGSLREGEEVEVTGRPTRHNYLQARAIRLLTTGEVVTGFGSGTSNRVGAVLIWVPFLTVVAICLAGIVIALITE